LSDHYIYPAHTFLQPRHLSNPDICPAQRFVQPRDLSNPDICSNQKFVQHRHLSNTDICPTQTFFQPRHLSNPDIYLIVHQSICPSIYRSNKNCWWTSVRSGKLHIFLRTKKWHFLYILVGQNWRTDKGRVKKNDTFVLDQTNYSFYMLVGTWTYDKFYS
jgi:hypothetical protein